MNSLYSSYDVNPVPSSNIMPPDNVSVGPNNNGCCVFCLGVVVFFKDILLAQPAKSKQRHNSKQFSLYFNIVTPPLFAKF